MIQTATNSYVDMDLLRLTTAGSVDDGKSTLIGRLLYDTKSIFEDQLESIERTSRQRGEGYVNLALLTDGLRAEREQNITIDVAYRYFATPKRKFIIADTPGHVQYTRNMVTGASTAELAIVLVDARKGVLTQSKRHGFISSLLRIPHVVVAVNKMDLVGYAEEAFDEIVGEYTRFAEKLQVQDLTFIPISALVGDNVVDRGENMPWYSGSTLLHHLESVNVGATRNLVDFRFPVQYVIRPHQDFRGFAGRIASGTIVAGEDVVVLPGGHGSRVSSIQAVDRVLETGSAGESVVIRLEDEIDVSRGDMIVRRKNVPFVGTRFEATLCWMSDRALNPAAPYLLMHTTRQTPAYVSGIEYRIDVDTLHREEVGTFGLNDIGRVEITCAQPIFFDSYERNHVTGSFVLIDQHSNVTVAAGMIRGPVHSAPPPAEAPPASSHVSPGVVWESWNISRAAREERNGHAAAVLWFTGLSGAGKSTIARELERRLFALGCQSVLLDGDQMRHGLCGDLGFAEGDRRENVRRLAEVARVMFEHGNIVLCALVSPYREDRSRTRDLLPTGRFVEIHVDVDLAICRSRDPKGLYQQVAAGGLSNMTGVDAPYEKPERPELRLDSTSRNVDELVSEVLDYLRREQIISARSAV